MGAVVGEVRDWFCGRGAELVGTARCVDIATTEELQGRPAVSGAVRCISSLKLCKFGRRHPSETARCASGTTGESNRGL